MLTLGKLLLSADDSVDHEYEVLDENGNTTNFAIQVTEFSEGMIFTPTCLVDNETAMWFGNECRTLRSALQGCNLYRMRNKI